MTPDYLAGFKAAQKMAAEACSAIAARNTSQKPLRAAGAWECVEAVRALTPEAHDGQ